MTIHFFTKGPKTAASSRQRAFLVAEELNRRGIKAIVHQPPLVLCSTTPWPGKIKLIFQYLKIFAQIKKMDTIYLQRTIYNKYFFVLIILYKLIFRRKIIFDFDDAIYSHSFFKTKTLTKLADVVIVGGHSLADWAKQYNKNVHIIPTSVEFENYAKYTKKYNSSLNKIVIGWVGNAVGHYENLKILVPVFEKLIKADIDFKFVLIGALGSQKVYDLFRNIEGLEVEFIDALDWGNPAAVPSHIQKFDIGVMPLVDNEWNRGKCAFKAIEYMACGIATICSAVGENNYLIKDGENGFLADTADEWVDKIKKIYNKSELLIKLGMEAQKTILKDYSFEANISKLMNIF